MEPDTSLATRIAEHLGAATGKPASVTSVEPLLGGACQENLRVDAVIDGERARFALRSDAATSLPESLRRKDERLAIEAAVHAGVKTPRARFPGEGLLRAGAGFYFLDWAEGESIGRKIVSAPHLAGARADLPRVLAVELAHIHGITPRSAPDLHGAAAAIEAERAGAGAAKIHLARIRRSIDAMHAPRPALELIHRWLLAHAPPPEPWVLVHGDFRTGNFLVTPAGLSAILDWEFAHFGSRYEDLAWISVRDWRFGKNDLPVGGFSRREPFYEAYEAASGVRLDPALLHYWEVFGNLNWAVGSVYQGERYVHGGADDFELVAIGRRAAEMEHEALRLIERGRL
jgi:aminoglycoside phosphotransferase (APT) family kinase protein